MSGHTTIDVRNIRDVSKKIKVRTESIKDMGKVGLKQLQTCKVMLTGSQVTRIDRHTCGKWGFRAYVNGRRMLCWLAGDFRDMLYFQEDLT